MGGLALFSIKKRAAGLLGGEAALKVFASRKKSSGWGGTGADDGRKAMATEMPRFGPGLSVVCRREYECVAYLNDAVLVDSPYADSEAGGTGYSDEKYFDGPDRSYRDGGCAHSQGLLGWNSDNQRSGRRLQNGFACFVELCSEIVGDSFVADKGSFWKFRLCGAAGVDYGDPGFLGFIGRVLNEDDQGVGIRVS